MTVPADFVIDLDVRWSDMDAFSHVNHARTVTIVEEARAAWLADAPRPAGDYVVRELRVRYQGQIRHSDSPLRVSLRAVSWTEHEFTAAYEIRLAGDDPAARPAVVAQTVMVLAGGADEEPIALSPRDLAFVRSVANPAAERAGP